MPPLPPPAPPLPAYGARSLMAAVPSVLAALGAEGFPNLLEVPPARCAVLLLVDGLGWELLVAHADDAPFLASRLGGARPITSGFPSSTAVSLAMLSTARPPVAHGLTGFTMAVPGADGAMNNITWAAHPSGIDLRDAAPPESIQPLPTVFEVAARAGVRMAAVGPAQHAGSGLSRAILRGGAFFPVGDGPGETARVVAEQLAGPRDGRRVAIYTYEPSVDAAGHRHGPGSQQWRAALRRADATARAIAAALPPDGLLALTADHGMVDLTGPEAVRVDIADRPDLAAGVRFLAGEARARHVHASAGEQDAVVQRWREGLDGLAWVASRDEAIAGGWFGPSAELRDGVAERIGDAVVAAADGRLGVFQRRVDPGEAQLAGHHGSFTTAELLVPWIVTPGLDAGEAAPATRR